MTRTTISAGEEPVEDERQERQPEDVEADVLVELRVLDPEVCAWVNRIHRCHSPETLPPASSAKNSETRIRIRPEYGADRLLVAGEHLVLGTQRARAGRDAVGDREARRASSRRRRSVNTAAGAKRAQSRPAPRLAEPDGVEPEVVGVEAGEAPRARGTARPAPTTRMTIHGGFGSAVRECAEREGRAFARSLEGRDHRSGGAAPAASAVRFCGTSRHRQPGWAGGCGCPVGNASPFTVGSSALSSQSGHCPSTRRPTAAWRRRGPRRRRPSAQAAASVSPTMASSSWPLILPVARTEPLGDRRVVVRRRRRSRRRAARAAARPSSAASPSTSSRGQLRLAVGASAASSRRAAVGRVNGSRASAASTATCAVEVGQHVVRRRPCP